MSVCRYQGWDTSVLVQNDHFEGLGYFVITVLVLGKATKQCLLLALSGMVFGGLYVRFWGQSAHGPTAAPFAASNTADVAKGSESRSMNFRHRTAPHVPPGHISLGAPRYCDDAPLAVDFLGSSGGTSNRRASRQGVRTTARSHTWHQGARLVAAISSKAAEPRRFGLRRGSWRAIQN